MGKGAKNQPPPKRNHQQGKRSCLSPVKGSRKRKKTTKKEQPCGARKMQYQTVQGRKVLGGVQREKRHPDSEKAVPSPGLLTSYLSRRTGGRPWGTPPSWEGDPDFKNRQRKNTSQGQGPSESVCKVERQDCGAWDKKKGTRKGLPGRTTQPLETGVPRGTLFFNNAQKQRGGGQDQRPAKNETGCTILGGIVVREKNIPYVRSPGAQWKGLVEEKGKDHSGAAKQGERTAVKRTTDHKK